MGIDLTALATIVTQLGVAYAALRLAKALKVRVDNHEDRIKVLELA